MANRTGLNGRPFTHTVLVVDTGVIISRSKHTSVQAARKYADRVAKRYTWCAILVESLSAFEPRGLI